MGFLNFFFTSNGRFYTSWSLLCLWHITHFCLWLYIIPLITLIQFAVMRPVRWRVMDEETMQDREDKNKSSASVSQKVHPKILPWARISLLEANLISSSTDKWQLSLHLSSLIIHILRYSVHITFTEFWDKKQVVHFQMKLHCAKPYFKNKLTACNPAVCCLAYRFFFFFLIFSMNCCFFPDKISLTFTACCKSSLSGGAGKLPFCALTKHMQSHWFGFIFTMPLRFNSHWHHVN